MANPKKPNPLALAHDARAETDTATIEADTAAETQPNSLAEQFFAGTGAAPEELQRQQEKKLLVQEQHDRVNPLGENVVGLHDRQKLVDTQELNELQQQFAAMAQKKQMPKAERPKIIEARVVDPGERKYVFTALFAAAKRKIEAFIPQPPYVVAKRRQARKNGMIANHEKTAEIQDTFSNHERSSNAGA